MAPETKPIAIVTVLNRDLLSVMHLKRLNILILMARFEFRVPNGMSSAPTAGKAKPQICKPEPGHAFDELHKTELNWPMVLRRSCRSNGTSTASAFRFFWGGVAC